MENGNEIFRLKRNDSAVLRCGVAHYIHWICVNGLVEKYN